MAMTKALQSVKVRQPDHEAATSLRHDLRLDTLIDTFGAAIEIAARAPAKLREEVAKRRRENAPPRGQPASA